MNSKAFMNTRADLNSLCNEVLEDRGPAYAGADLEGDRFANFRLIADLFGNFDVNPNDPKAVLMVYMLKHVFSVLAFIGQSTEGDEKIEGRLVDIRNYVDLLYALIKEERALKTLTESILDPLQHGKFGSGTYIPGQPCPECGHVCAWPEENIGVCCACHSDAYDGYHNRAR